MSAIEILQADITQLAVDVIVNAAHRCLPGRGKVAGVCLVCCGEDVAAACREALAEPAGP